MIGLGKREQPGIAQPHSRCIHNAFMLASSDTGRSRRSWHWKGSSASLHLRMPLTASCSKIERGSPILFSVQQLLGRGAPSAAFAAAQCQHTYSGLIFGSSQQMAQQARGAAGLCLVPLRNATTWTRRNARALYSASGSALRPSGLLALFEADHPGQLAVADVGAGRHLGAGNCYLG